MKCFFYVKKNTEYIYDTYSVTSSMPLLLPSYRTKAKLNTEALTTAELNIHSGHPLKTQIVCLPEGAAKAHKLGYFTYMWEPTKHFSPLSVILIAQHDSLRSHPPSYPPYGQMAFFTVCGLLHLQSKSLEGAGGMGYW